MLALIALRNLARNRRRTLLSLSVISFGFAAILMTGGFVRHSFRGLSEAMISGGLGHLEVSPVTAGSDPTDQTVRPPTFKDWRAMRDTIEGRPNVRAAEASIQFAGVVANGERSVSFVGLAVEPDRERKLGTEVRIRAGENLPEALPADGGHQVLLGTGLARALAAKPGDIITVMAVTPGASLNAVDVTVAGIYTTGLQELDARLIKTRLETAQELLGISSISALIVGLTSDDFTASAEADLRERLAGSSEPVSVINWQARAPFYTQVRGLYIGIFAFLGAIVAILVALSSANTMLMSVLERVREFGMLLAIGTSRAQIAQLLILEAVWLAVIGGITGGALGAIAVMGINGLGIKMPPPPGAVDPIDLALIVSPTDFLFITAALTVVLVLSAVPPLMRVFRLRIVEALGHV